MQICSFPQIQKVQSFKDRIMDSVEHRCFEEKKLEHILQDTFGKNNVDVLYDDEFLESVNLDASHVMGDKHHFVFKQDSFEYLRNKNIKDLRREGILNKFADFYESVTHELTHGIYEEENKGKIDFLTNTMAKFLKKPEDKEKLMGVCFDLTQKILNVYDEPAQISRAVEYQSKKLSFDRKSFAKFLHLNLLDSVKDETFAYIEGFKARKDILGENTSFSHHYLSFNDAKEYINASLHMAREAYFNKYVPVKNLNRYF